MRVLLIEADPKVASRIRDGLSRELISVGVASAPGDGLPLEADVVLIGLPDGDRHAICRSIREGDPRRRIVMLTPGGTEPQAVAALEAGADHVLPRDGISPRELAARLRAVARRRGGGAAPPDAAIVVAGALRIDPAGRRVELEGAEVFLAGTELELLLGLAATPDRPVERDRLAARIWAGHPVGERTLDTVVKRLRARLGPHGDRIETLRGVGYRLRI